LGSMENGLEPMENGLGRVRSDLGFPGFRCERPDFGLGAPGRRL
jgi:hypothetical protein